MDEGGEEEPELDLAALDELVSEFMYEEGLVQDVHGRGASKEALLRRSCVDCRELVERGDVAGAIEKAEAVCPQVLQNPQLLFRIKRQQFVEFLRAGETDRAIGLLRTEVAPMALDAYPEAYAEFKRSMLLLVYEPGLEGTPVEEEGSVKQREEVGRTLEQTLRHALGVYEPRLALLLHYLIQVCHASATVAGLGAERMATMEHIQLEGRDPPALAKDCIELRTFPESAVQALANAVGITRQEAELALRRSEGNLENALKAELSRMRMHTGTVDRLVHEYAYSRGLIPVGEGLPDYSPESLAMSGPALSGTKRPVADDHCSGAWAVLGSDVAGANWQLPQWCGRRRKADGDVDVSKGGGSAKWDGQRLYHKSETYAATARLHSMACKGLVDEVLHGVQELDPTFFAANPEMLFELKRCEFAKRAEAGDIKGALQLARKDLRPLTERWPSLLGSLKSTLASLFQSEQHCQTSISPRLAAILQSALRKRLGLEEPALIQLVRTALKLHGEWFRLQRWEDRFASMIGITALKICTSEECKSAGEGSDDAEPMATEGGTETGSDDEADREGVTESAILTFMEFMHLPRLTAIEILAQYDNRVEEAIAELIG